MENKTIYLAGLISTEFPESLSWRWEAEELLRSPFINVLSPMRGKDNLVKTSKDGGITDPALTPKDIIYRDYADISQSDLILAHLDTFGSTRPMVGTMFELAWAWDRRVPVVAIAKETNILMRTHPFVCEAVSHYCASLEEAIAIIERHYCYGLLGGVEVR